MSKIKNDEKKVKKTKDLNDIDILNDVLLSFKMLTDNYAIALNEASNNKIYNIYKKEFDSISQIQQELFNLSFKNGWYQLEEAKKQKIAETIKQFTNKTKELNANE